jgi:hypothetical protein
MNYEVGKQYEMTVVDIRKDSAGYNYIALHDDDPSKEYRVYNILKCQYDSLPDTLYVTVKSIDVFGKIKFVQDEARLNREHYQEGKLYAFEVTDVKEDFRTKVTFYVLEDDFSTHRMFFKGEQKYQIGDSCILEVTGFSDKGNLKLKEVAHADKKPIDKAVQDTKDDTENKLAALWNSLPVLNVGDENQTLELKTSIAFPPGEGKANIGKQLYNILKELTAFMNTKGGTLYIGVHDKSKKVISIEGDYKFLNDDEEDDFNGTYKEDKDGYELKIRNTIDRLCPSLANSLLDIKFETLEKQTYCKIEVQPARRPIFLSGTQLYIRQGNRLKLLRGDEITFFITERMTISIKDVLDTDGLSANGGSFDMDAMKQIMRSLINERRAIPKDLPKPKSLGEVDYWIIWYNDGTWKRSRQQSSEANAYMQVPIYKNLSDPILAFCYDTNRVNTVKLSDFRKGANLNVIQKNGWSRTGDKPKNIFLMHATDFLVGYSVDSNGIEAVKLHAISDYGTTASAANQGSPFLPDTSRIETYAVIGAEHKKNIAHLIVTKAKRSVEVGTPLTSPALKNEIEYLENILKG